MGKIKIGDVIGVVAIFGMFYAACIIF